MAITVVAVFTVVCAVVMLAVYLVSTNVDDQRGTAFHHKVLRGVPLQAFKSIVVVWQILTQVILPTDPQ